MKITVSYKAGHFGLLMESKHFNFSIGAGRPSAKISSLRADRINSGNVFSTPTTNELYLPLEKALDEMIRNSSKKYYEEELTRELNKMDI